MQANRLSIESYDAVERGLVRCLEALAHLANSDGQADRVERFLEAAEAIGSTACEHEIATSDLRLPDVADAQTLTTREYEVAILIARSFTNRQIADELIISERTADTHVQNILGKLGLVSRVQVGAWLLASRHVLPKHALQRSSMRPPAPVPGRRDRQPSTQVPLAKRH